MAIGEVPRRRALSVRVRLMLPIAIAITGMLVLGTIQVGQALTADADAGRARVLADMARTTAQLLQAGQEEVAATIQSHELGGQTNTRHGYQDQIDKTDNFVSEFAERSTDVRAEVPELDAVLLTASGALGQLFDARAYLKEYAEDRSVSRTDPDVENGLALYRSVADRVLGVADALHLYVSDRELAEQTRALAALAGAKQAAGDQRFLAHNMLAEAERDSDDDGEVDKLPAEGLSELAVYHGVEQQRLGDFYLAAESQAKAEYSTIVVGPAVEQAAQVVNNLLKGLDAGRTSTEWDDAQSDRIESLHEVESALSEDLIDTAAGKERSAQQNALLTGAIVLALAIATFAAATVFAIRISRRLRVLRRDALTAAKETLPEAVAEMTDARSERQVNEAVSTAESGAIVHRGGPEDEVAAVASAFTVVHQRALRLAADQAMLRLDVAAMMIALARRGQSLVQRQLHMITEFTAEEHNPASVERFAALNHLAARMRRNEENLLLLAGGDPGRRHNAAISVSRAVTEAAAEIEDSPRVVVEDTADTLIVASAVGDVVHLLAELLENAATFSPPRSQVRVATRRTVTELVISISDEGIGLQEEQVTEINARLAEPSGLTSSLAGTMGLLVVGRLAARHGIDVQLHSTANKGTLAVARLPESLIANSSEPIGFSKRHAFDFSPDPRRGPTRPEPVAGARSLPELSDRPDTSPMTGTGETTPGRDEAGDIVPRPRDPRSPRTATPDEGAVETGWFLPSTGSGDLPAVPPGSLRWRSSLGDVAYDEARQVIAAAESETPSVTSDGGLPRRRPGARLLPGSIDVPTAPAAEHAPAVRSTGGGDFGADAIDPDEIRNRLAGFAGGIAAASEAGTGSDPYPGRSDS